MYWQSKTRPVKKITRTIEKYDKHGNYKGKEVITEEEEIYDKMVYEQVPVWPLYPPYEITCEYDKGTGGYFDSGDTLTTDENVSVNYTNQNTLDGFQFNSVNMCVN